MSTGNEVSYLASTYGIQEYDAGILADNKDHVAFFEQTVKLGASAKAVSNWFMTEILRLLSENGKTINECSLTPEAMAELVDLVDRHIINGPTAKELLQEIFYTGAMPGALVKDRNLMQISDVATLSSLIDQAFAEVLVSLSHRNQGPFTKAGGLIVGKVMKFSDGKADPKLVGELVASKLLTLKMALN